MLEEFITSDEFRIMPYIPVSYLRAVSHINNPRVRDNDVLLLLCYSGDKLEGYLGVIPDIAYINGREVRFGWMSCIWAHPESRGRGIAKTLTLKAIELYNNRIVCTEFTPVAENLYNKLIVFDNLIIKHGIRYYRRSCMSYVIPQRVKSAGFFSPVFALADFFVNIFFDFRLVRVQKPPASLQLEYLPLPDLEMEEFIKNKLNAELNRRGVAGYRWLLMYPWIKETHVPGSESKKYAFTCQARKFRQGLIKIKNYSCVIAYILYSIRDNHLKTPYIYVENGYEYLINPVIEKIMRENKIDILTTYQKCITQYKIHSIISKKISRKYLKSKGFEITAVEESLQDGDGDCGFT